MAYTFYRIYNDTFTTDWTEYSEPFVLTGLTDGGYAIDYYSIDNAGNIELPNSVLVN